MKKYIKPSNYINHIQMIVNKYGLPFVEPLLKDAKHNKLPHKPIFILGAPRSGSTLLIQTLSNTLDLAYLSNAHCKWFGAPALVEMARNKDRKHLDTQYVSQHGATFEDHAPSECGEWWYRFFPRSPQYVRLQDVTPEQMNKFRVSLASMISTAERPMIFKNLLASLRIQPIAKYTPESLFIVIKRNEIDNGHSLLEARNKVNGDYSTWWAMEPPNIERLKRLPAHEQVIEQIRQIYACIESDYERAGLSKESKIYVDYDEFCDNPGFIVRKIVAFLQSNGCSVTLQGQIPTSFSKSTEVRIDRELYALMVDYAQQNRNGGRNLSLD